MMTLIMGWFGIGAGTLALIVAAWFFGPMAIWAFFQTSLGRIVAVCGLIVVLSLGIGQTFYNKAKRECAAANEQRGREIEQRDKTISELKGREADRLAAEQFKTEDIDNAVQSKLEAELAKRKPADRCDLTGADADRLR